MEGRGREEGLVLPEQQSKARRNAKESNRFERGKIKGGKSCPGAPQSINLLFKGGTADAVAGNGRSRTDWREEGKRKKRVARIREQKAEREALVELRNREYKCSALQCSVMQCSAAAGDVLTR